MNKTIGIVLLVLAVLVGGFFLMNRGNTNGDAMEKDDTATSTETGDAMEGDAMNTPAAGDSLQYKGLGPGATDENGARVVLYTGEGFFPAQITVNAGTVLRFINLDNLALIVEGIEYEGGKAYQDFLGPKALGFGEDFVFTFTQEGVWSYRNQLTQQNIGTVVVKPQ